MLAAAIAASPSGACGCGIAIQATVPAERALIVQRGGQEQLVVSFDILSKGAHGAVVMPVPARPHVEPAPAGLFTYLERATRPRVRIIHQEPRDDEGIGGGAVPPGVDLLSNQRTGNYQVATLGTDSQASALSVWLGTHGYKLPTGAPAIIASYLKQGWSFVAVRLVTHADGALTPLSIRFASKQPIYPMRLEQLGTEPVSVDLYVVGDHRTDVARLDPAYAGPVTALRPVAPAAVKPYLAGAWITREKAENLEPSTLTADFVARRASSDIAYRMVIDEVRYDATAATTSDSNSSNWWIWVAVAIGAFLIIDFFVLRAVLRRRGAGDDDGPSLGV